MSGPMSLGRLRDLALGLGYGGLVLAIGVGSWLFYNQVFTDRSDITLVTGTVGNALQDGSDVKLDGVPVGTVTDIEPRDGGAELTLALEPDALDQLPVDTTARLLPKTLFGERYVALIVPEGGDSGVVTGAAAASSTSGMVAAGDTLEPGDTITQDGSAEAVELEEVFDELLPVLQAIQPDKLSATLGELTLMLRGNGADIGQAMTDWGLYLKKLNPLTPQMADDLAALGRVAETYAVAAPDLIDALATMTTTSATLVDQQSQLTDVYANVVVAADDSNGWMIDNEQTIRVLSERSRDALGAVAPYSRQFPCLFRAVRDYIPVMDEVLGKGTDEPGIHVVLNITPSRGAYVLGKDDPTYATDGRPRCPYQDGSTRPLGATGEAVSAGEPERISPPPTDRVRRLLADGGGLGEANSPAENQLIAELMAPTVGMAPADYPDGASLLLGPLLRGAEVELR
jgi:phospholipid/cholesterol/gamma-HCH transport system substrate-binding protein